MILSFEVDLLLWLMAYEYATSSSRDAIMACVRIVQSEGKVNTSALEQIS